MPTDDKQKFTARFAAAIVDRLRMASAISGTPQGIIVERLLDEHLPRYSVREKPKAAQK